MAVPMPKQVNDGVPGLDGRLTFERQQRQQQMAAAWKAYRGEWGAGPLKVRGNQPDDNVRVNRCAPIVDKGVSFLFGKVVKIVIEDLDGGSDGASEPLQDWLNAAWGDDDDKMTLLSKLAMNGGICGHTFAKVIPPNPRAGQVYPRVIALDPQTVTVENDPEDCDSVRRYIIEQEAYDPDLQTNVARRQVIARNDPDGLAAASGGMDSDDTWVITTSVRSGVGGVWRLSGEPVVWPYPMPPIVDCQNLPNPNQYWGLPDLTPDLIDMNRMLNFVESNTSRIIKTHAHPWAWASGVDARVLTIEPGEVTGLPHPDAKMGLLEMHGDLHSSMTFAEDLRGNMDEQSRVPAVALGRLKDLPRGTISGVALQLLFQPLIEKTTLKQRLYGRMIRDISRLMLLVGAFPKDVIAQVRIEPHWQNLLPIDDLAAAQTALALSQVGVSQQTLLTELGYDPDAEATKTAEAATRQVTAFSRGQGLPPASPSPGAPPAPAGQPPVAPADSQPDGGAESDSEQ